MSKRVFLSYRRSDTADQAIALKIVLEQKLPQIVVFVDTESINPAERWPERLTNTLEHSSVVVALIGPRWRFGSDGTDRFADPQDWVRQEVAYGLAKRPQTFIPVLFDNVLPAKLAALAEPLHRLASLQNVSLALDTFDDRIEELLDVVDGYLREPDQRPRPQRISPPLLPQLCDRVPQEDALIELFTGGAVSSKTPVIFVYGHKWEDHLGFLERVKYKRILADVFGGA